jgi:hypothetical protein
MSGLVAAPMALPQMAQPHSPLSASQSHLYMSRREAAASLLARGPYARGARHFGDGAVHIHVGELTVRGPLPPVGLSLQLVVMGRLARSFRLSLPTAEVEAAAQPGGAARIRIDEAVHTQESAEAMGALLAGSPLCEARLLQASGTGGADETLAIAAVDLAAMTADLEAASLPLLRPEGAIGSIVLSVRNRAEDTAEPGGLGSSSRAGSVAAPHSRPASARSSLRASGVTVASSRPGQSGLSQSSLSARSQSKLGFGVSSAMSLGSAAPAGLSDAEAERRRLQRDEMIQAQEAWWSAWRVRQLRAHREWPRWEQRMRAGYVVVVAEVRCQRKLAPPAREGGRRKKSARQIEQETRGVSVAERRAFDLSAKKEAHWHDCQMSTRQDEDKYETYTKMARDALASALGDDGGEVVVVPDSKEAWDERPTGTAWAHVPHRSDRRKWQDEANDEHLRADRSFSSVRFGAFELQAVYMRHGAVESSALHSKLASRLWPSKAKLQRLLLAFLPKELVLSFVVPTTDGAMRPVEVDDARLRLTAGEQRLELYGGAVSLPSGCGTGSLVVEGGGPNDDWERHAAHLDFDGLATGAAFNRVEVEVALQPTRRAFELPIELVSLSGARMGGVRLVATASGARTAECTLPPRSELRTDSSGAAMLRWYGHVERVDVTVEGAVATGDGAEAGVSASTWPARGDDLNSRKGRASLPRLRIVAAAARPAEPAAQRAASSTAPRAASPAAQPSLPAKSAELRLAFSVRCDDGSLRPVAPPDQLISAHADGGPKLSVSKASMRPPADAARLRLSVDAGPDADWEAHQQTVSLPAPSPFQVVLEPSRRAFELPVLVKSNGTGTPQPGVRLIGTPLGRRTRQCSLPPVAEARTDANGMATFRWRGHVEHMLVSVDGKGYDTGAPRVCETADVWPEAGEAATRDGHSVLRRMTLRIAPRAHAAEQAPSPAKTYSPPPVPMATEAVRASPVRASAVRAGARPVARVQHDEEGD